MCYTASGAAVSDGVGVVYPAGKVAVVLAQPLDEEGAEMEGEEKAKANSSSDILFIHCN